MNPLSGWENFYVILGSSAGALIGLEFVVITLTADRAIRDSVRASAAFATPTVVHFGAVLLLAALVSAPWDNVEIVAALWGATGVFGVVYTLLVVRRMRVQTAYQPEFEDWLFHAILPAAAYAGLAAAAAVSRPYLRESLFAVAAAALLLLFAGIHNAWDAITYHVYTRQAALKRAKEEGSSHAETQTG